MSCRSYQWPFVSESSSFCAFGFPNNGLKNSFAIITTTTTKNEKHTKPFHLIWVSWNRKRGSNVDEGSLIRSTSFAPLWSRVSLRSFSLLFSILTPSISFRYLNYPKLSQWQIIESLIQRKVPQLYRGWKK
jgi:hypothetical protein